MGVREALFAPEVNPVGEYIDINGVSFLIIGVFDFESYGGDRRGRLETIYIPLTTLQRTFNLMNRVGWYSVLIEDGTAASDVETAIKSLLMSRHEINPKDNRALGSWDSSREYKNLQGLFTGIRVFIWVVGIGTLLAGIVGVSNIMLIIVQERTREIGIRKALGATPFSIISMILQEAFFITALSGYLGVISGIMVMEGISVYVRKRAMDITYFDAPEISLAVALSAMGLLVVAGTLAGLFPALKASKIHPVEALREE
jgi:putative ABC transport system permease protein